MKPAFGTKPGLQLVAGQASERIVVMKGVTIGEQVKLEFAQGSGGQLVLVQAQRLQLGLVPGLRLGWAPNLAFALRLGLCWVGLGQVEGLSFASGRKLRESSALGLWFELILVFVGSGLQQAL